MSLLSPQLTKLLDPIGFHEEVTRVYSVSESMTLEFAYNEVERSHFIICGRPRYVGGFESFKRAYSRYNGKGQKWGSNREVE